MNTKEVIAKLDKLKSEGGTTKEDIKNTLAIVINQFTGDDKSEFFYGLQDLDSAIDDLKDKPLKMKLRKVFNAGDKLLRKTEEIFLSISEEL